MLTNEQLMENKMKYLELLTTLGVDLTEFSRYLGTDRVKFFEKPFNHLDQFAYAGSLCEHSLKYYEELVKLSSTLCPGAFSAETLLKVGLLMNIYRAEMFEPYLKNVKSEATGQWEQVVAYRPKEDRPSFGVYGLSSYMIAKKFFDLSDEEAMAIIYAEVENPVDSYMLRKNFPIVNLAQMAHYAVIYNLEGVPQLYE